MALCKQHLEAQVYNEHLPEESIPRPQIQRGAESRNLHLKWHSGKEVLEYLAFANC